MNKQEIINAAITHQQKLRTSLDGESYQLRGVLNSEALLLVAIAEALGADTIVESGRARGHSTNLLAKYFTDTNLKITSIDFDATSEDAVYSEKYLAKYPNVQLIYGDAHKVIEEHVTENTVVFIDGPKGDEALQLGAKLLHDARVKAVCIHDLHQNTFHRNIAEAIFSNHFFSDDADFVETFRELDDNCWQVLDGTGEAPYQRYHQPIASYASTLGVFFNGPGAIVEPAYGNYRAYYQGLQPTFKKAFIANTPHNSLLYRGVKRLHSLFAK